MSARTRVPLSAVSILLLVTAAARGAVFQYALEVATSRGERTALLWIPPRAQKVRGVVMAGMTLMEREFVKDPRIRDACAAEQLAIVFFKCGLGAVDVERVLAGFASISGYEELSSAPLMFVGHSAGGPQAKAAAIRFADRCFGLVQYRGGVPGGDDPAPPGVPVLMMVGQFDEFGGTMRDGAGRESWEGGRDALAAFRAKDERNLGSIVVEPGAGHFAWSDRNAAYLALFIRKALQARNPSAPIRPESGWLSDLEIKTPGRFQPSPYRTYEGPKSEAAWHFDREMANVTVAYHSGGFGKKDQFIRWEDPHWVDAGARFFFTSIQWVGDGETFQVHPAYADEVPGQYDGRGPRWPLAGQPVGHSSAPIDVRPVGGPIVVKESNVFRIQFDGLAPAGGSERVTFLAFSKGDGEYRYTERVGMLPRGFRGLTKGRPQTLRFEPVRNLKVDGAPVELIASSDSGLPVEFYVAYGPAIVADGMLRISELPARAKLPIPVGVVAWQFGRGVEPLVETAEPVEQTILIEEGE